MQETSHERQARFAQEASRILQREGFGVMQLENGELEISKDSVLLGTVYRVGVTIPCQENLSEETMETLDKVRSLLHPVDEYMSQMEAAPFLKAGSLKGGYRLLSEFGNVVLAGRYTNHGADFVTWEWSWDHKSVFQGHYFGDEYTAAKKDFALRSGLVPREQFFDHQQLVEIDRCCEVAKAEDEELTFEREQLIDKIREQIRQIDPTIGWPEQEAGQGFQTQQL